MADEKKPAEEKPKATAAAKKPAASKAAAEKPAAKASTTKAAADKASTAKTAADKPAAKASTAKAAADKPAAKASTSKATAAKTDTAAKSEAKPAAKKAAPKAKSNDVARPQVLKMHHLRPAPGAKTERTRVGRGEASKGKTAGRGTKGTKARYQVRAGLEGGNLNSIMRAPKLRGFKNPFRVEYQVVNLERLAELYPKGGDVTVTDLVAKGVVRKNEKVKVLGTGDIDVKLNVAVDKVSVSAEQKIVAAGGSVK
jgi:large subunit ribosomal protein L15